MAEWGSLTPAEQEEARAALAAGAGSVVDRKFVRSDLAGLGKTAYHIAKPVLGMLAGQFSGVGDMARGLYETGKDAVTLPGDVYAGRETDRDRIVGRSMNLGMTLPMGGLAAASIDAAPKGSMLGMNAPFAPKPAPNALSVAIRHPRTGEVIVGKPGQIHADLYNQIGEFPSETARGDQGWAFGDKYFGSRPEALAYLESTEPEVAAQLGRSRRNGGLEAQDLNAARAAVAETKLPPLEGMPLTANIPGMGEIAVGPSPRIRAVAADYMKGKDYNPPRDYRPVDPQQAAQVADEFERMPHNPSDPATAEAYNALIAETKAQWDAIQKSGLKVEFMRPGMEDPYAASPRLAVKDIEDNNHLWVYPTESGFGKEGFDPKGNPMLNDSGVVIDGRPVANNDLFRIVHDYFGHGKEGVGFRATGEDNAFRQHRSMFSPEAQRALTTETRGQNSWLNYGPHGAKNRTANTADTVFADQKVGLLPEWTSLYANSKDAAPLSLAAGAGERPKNIPGSDWYHGTTHDFDKFDLSKGDPEGHLGRSVYATNNLGDAELNYSALSGADLKLKIERRAEQLANEAGKDLYDLPRMDDIYTPQAEAELIGSAPGTIKNLKIKDKGVLQIDKDEIDLYDPAVYGKFDKAVRGAIQSYTDRVGGFAEHVNADDLINEVTSMGAVDAKSIDSTMRQYLGADILKDIYKRMGYRGVEIDAYDTFPRMVRPGTRHRMMFKKGTVRDANTGDLLYSNSKDAAPLSLAAGMADADTIRAYHGTFNPDAATQGFKRRRNDLGIHFGTAGQAEDRLLYTGHGSEMEGAAIIPVDLNIKNPLRMDDLGRWNSDNLEFGLERAGFSPDEIKRALRSSGNEAGKTAALRRLIESKGYDGVVYKNTGETSGAHDLQLAQEEAWQKLKKAQMARGKRLDSFDLEDQQTPEYLAHKKAYDAQKAFRDANAEDSYIAFKKGSVKSAIDGDTLFANSKDAAPLSMALAGGDFPFDQLTKKEQGWVKKGMTPEQAQIMSVASQESPKKPYLPENVPFDNPGIAPGDTRISTRVPQQFTDKGNPRPWVSDPYKEHLAVDTNTMSMMPSFEHNMSLISDYPGFEHLRGKPAGEVADRYINQTVGNTLHLFSRLPGEVLDRSPKWYEGAQRLSGAFAEKWGVARHKVSAALAALSPQKDWFQNVSLAQRVGDVMFTDIASKPASKEMIKWAKTATKSNSDELLFSKPEDKAIIKRIIGKRFDELADDDARAMWVRAYDETHNANRRAYREVTPEGDVGPWALNDDGTPGKVAWGSMNEIKKAISTLRAGADPQEISRILSDTHKVRSFYNNIENPWDARFGDATVDTHAVGASQLRSVSQKDPAVLHNFALSPMADKKPAGFRATASAGVNDTGIKGTYPLLNDTLRQAGDILGLLPRQVQSPTWEGIRLRFPRELKGEAGEFNPDAVWRAFDRGEITLDQARDLIVPEGSIPLPSYAQKGYFAADPRFTSTYANPVTAAPMSLLPPDWDKKR